MNELPPREFYVAEAWDGRAVKADGGNWLQVSGLCYTEEEARYYARETGLPHLRITKCTVKGTVCWRHDDDPHLPDYWGTPR